MKNKVCTITPNPALDLSGLVKNLRPNEKSYVYNEIRAPGGNSINSARILNRLKVPVFASGFLGGSTGDEIKSLLDSENLQHEFIQIQSSSRVNVTVSNEFDHRQTRLSFPGPVIRKTEKDCLFAYFEKQKNIEFLVLGGSLPKGFEPTDIIRLMKICDRKSIKSIIDCPGSIMARVVTANPFFIKPNLYEFQELTDSHARTIGSVTKKAKKLLAHVPYLCISSVEEGALLITRKGNYFGRIPKIKIQSTVGAGDSMVGAMVAQFYKGEYSGENVLRWGLAAAAATLSTTGTSLGIAKDIIHFYKKTRVETLIS